MVGFNENNFWDIRDQYTDKLFLGKKMVVYPELFKLCVVVSVSCVDPDGDRGPYTPPPEKPQK